jgi:hypothetical protein
MSAPRKGTDLRLESGIALTLADMDFLASDVSERFIRTLENVENSKTVVVFKSDVLEALTCIDWQERKLSEGFSDFLKNPSDIVFLPLFQEDKSHWNLIVYERGGSFYVLDSRYYFDMNFLSIVCTRFALALSLNSVDVFYKSSPLQNHCSESGIHVLENIKYVIEHCIAKQKGLAIKIERPQKLSVQFILKRRQEYEFFVKQRRKEERGNFKQ